MPDWLLVPVTLAMGGPSNKDPKAYPHSTTVPFLPSRQSATHGPLARWSWRLCCPLSLLRALSTPWAKPQWHLQEMEARRG